MIPGNARNYYRPAMAAALQQQETPAIACPTGYVSRSAAGNVSLMVRWGEDTATLIRKRPERVIDQMAFDAEWGYIADRCEPIARENKRLKALNQPGKPFPPLDFHFVARGGKFFLTWGKEATNGEGLPFLDVTAPGEIVSVPGNPLHDAGKSAALPEDLTEAMVALEERMRTLGLPEEHIQKVLSGMEAKAKAAAPAKTA